MESISIRQATNEDNKTIGALLAASYPVLMTTHYEPEILALALPLMTRANPRLLGSGTFYVAESDNHRVIGCGGWSNERPDTGDITDGLAHIRHFATHAKWIGHGIGRALYDTCEREARHTGVTRFECYASLNAQAFYVALGFDPIKEMTVSMGPGVDFKAMHMQRGI